MATPEQNLKAEQAKSAQNGTATTATSATISTITANTVTTPAVVVTPVAEEPTLKKEEDELAGFSETFKTIIKEDNIVQFISYLQLECDSDPQGLQILFFAAKKGRVHIVTQLLTDRPDFIFAKYKDKTLFDIADPRVHAVLISDLEGALDGAVPQSEEDEAVLKEFSEILTQALKKSAEKARNAFKGKSDAEMLCNLAQHGKIVSFKAILKTAPSLEMINNPIANGYRPVHFAAMYNQPVILDFIVDIWRQTRMDEVLLVKSDQGLTAMDLAVPAIKSHLKFKEAYEKALSNQSPAAKTEQSTKTKEDKAKAATCHEAATTAMTATTATTVAATQSASEEEEYFPNIKISNDLREAIKEDSFQSFVSVIEKCAPSEMINALFHAAKKGATNILFGHFKQSPTTIFVKCSSKRTFFDVAPHPSMKEELLKVLDKALASPGSNIPKERIQEFSALGEKLTAEIAASEKAYAIFAALRYQVYKGKSDAKILFDLAAKGKVAEFKAMVQCAAPQALLTPIEGGYCAVHAAACHDQIEILDIILQVWRETQDDNLLLAPTDNGRMALDLAAAGGKADTYKPFVEACRTAYSRSESKKEKIAAQKQVPSKPTEQVKSEKAVLMPSKEEAEKIVSELRSKTYKGKSDAKILYNLAGKGKVREFAAMVHCAPKSLSMAIEGGFCAIHAAASYDQLEILDIILKVWRETQDDNLLLAENFKGKTALDIASVGAQGYNPFVEACQQAISREKIELPKRRLQRQQQETKLIEENARATKEHLKLMEVAPQFEPVTTDDVNQAKLRRSLFDLKGKMVRLRNLEFMEGVYSDEMFHSDLISSENVSALQNIMNLGANPFPKGTTTWMHEAARKDKTKVLDLLLEQSRIAGNLQTHVSALDERGRTPFECAGEKAKNYPAFKNAAAAIQKEREKARELELLAAEKEEAAKEAHELKLKKEMDDFIAVLKQEEDAKIAAYEAAIKEQIKVRLPKEVLEAIQLDKVELLAGAKLAKLPIEIQFLCLRHAINEGAVNVLQRVIRSLPPEIIFSEDDMEQTILDFVPSKNQEAIRALLEERIWRRDDFRGISDSKKADTINGIVYIKKRLILKAIEGKNDNPLGATFAAAPVTTSTIALATSAATATTSTAAASVKTQLQGKAIFFETGFMKDKMLELVPYIEKDDLPHFALSMQPVIDRIKKYPGYTLNELVVCELRGALITLAQKFNAYNILFCYLGQDEIFVSPQDGKQEKESAIPDPAGYITPDPVDRVVLEKYHAEVAETHRKNCLTLD